MSSSPPLIPPTGAPRHHWKFFRTGGLDQVALTSGADLQALDQLDPKLWVALSCPVKGLELDEKTLALIDADGDGRIRVPELIAAVTWATERLKDPATLLRGADSLPLAVINDATPDGKIIQAAAKQILVSLGRPGDAAIGVGDTSDVAKIFSASALNGDGVIPVEATEDADARALIQDAVACMGGVADRTGSIGTTAEKTEEFYRELAAYVAWVEQGAAQGIALLGDNTAAACAAVQTVRAKVDDYFARCRLAGFDARAIAALNRSETEYLAIAARDLKITAEEVAGFPLARVEAGRPLPLLDGVNPAWAGPLATLHATVVTPLLGASRKTLTEDDWKELNAKLAPYEAWIGSKAGAKVEPLGVARARDLLAGKGRETLHSLIAQDQALAPEFNAISAVDRLVRYHRDLRALLHNFVNFADFYSRDRLAVFQAGTLYVDSRSCELCIRVDDPGAHAGLAASSKAYIAYVDCRRPSGETMKIAACVTQGDSDYLVTGRNGLFIDRKGRDWDATITKIIDNPISLRQAFWSPYKKFIRMIEEQVAKRAAAADAEANTKLASTAESAANADKNKAAPKKIDVGTVAALGVAVGAIGGALATLATGLAKLEPWQLPLVVLAAMLIISTPAVVIAWLKLRQRTLGPILDANGWAVNGRVQINIPFGTALTEQATLPAGATRSLKDPYAEKKGGRRTVIAVVILLLVLLGLAKIFGFWPFGPFFDGSGEMSSVWK
ncbi:MAG TPA: hypothetical protein PLU52_00250 [Opitutaceae bacterium]|nr:hypothetical protein [Opitutaceae bacterium]HND60569.1 hypothetical protein [Opitutaceae bacterium]